RRQALALADALDELLVHGAAGTGRVIGPRAHFRLAPARPPLPLYRPPPAATCPDGKEARSLRDMRLAPRKPPLYNARRNSSAAASPFGLLWVDCCNDVGIAEHVDQSAGAAGQETLDGVMKGGAAPRRALRMPVVSPPPARVPQPFVRLYPRTGAKNPAPTPRKVRCGVNNLFGTGLKVASPRQIWELSG